MNIPIFEEDHEIEGIKQDILIQYKTEKYIDYVKAQANYNMHHKFSDLLAMIDNGICCNMITQEDLKNIILKQDELTQKILLAQYGKHIIVK